MSQIVPVILGGGSGTRLWPRSRARAPKPFIPLLGEKTLYQATLERCSDPAVFAPPVVVVGEQHLAFAQAQAAQIAPDARFIIEPMGRNTAPAVALAAHAVALDDILLVCPSDHHIVDSAAFRNAVVTATVLARSRWLVSFGIAATAPETGYGYICRGEPLGEGFRVRSFVEKPDLERALAFLADGNYAWNGGIFAYRAGTFLDELATHRPELAKDIATAFAAAKTTGSCITPDAELFAALKGESVDYAVMENTTRAAMVDADIGWSDIGSWNALLQARSADADGNVRCGPGEFIGSRGSMIESDGHHVTVIGVEDVVVVVDGEDVLVVARDATQRVGEASRCRSQ